MKNKKNPVVVVMTVLLIAVVVSIVAIPIYVYYFDRAPTCVTVGVEGVPCKRENLTPHEYDQKYPKGLVREGEAS
jgi:Tfp pilus assembly major pilin PilA